MKKDYIPTEEYLGQLELDYWKDLLRELPEDLKDYKHE